MDGQLGHLSVDALSREVERIDEEIRQLNGEITRATRHLTIEEWLREYDRTCRKRDILRDEQDRLLIELDTRGKDGKTTLFELRRLFVQRARQRALEHLQSPAASSAETTSSP